MTTHTTRQYTRDDVEYDGWYSDWMKQLARTMTRSEIETALGIVSVEVKVAARLHHNAIARTTSMQGNSQGRAQAGNVVAAKGEYKIALSGALEIYDLFPEHAKDHSS